MSKKNELIKSASVIVLGAIKNAVQGEHDYKVMLLKRNKNMRFASGQSVFPGGKFDKHIDGSPEWLKLIGSSFGGLVHANSIGTKRGCISQVPLEVSYRLCAIRETFEETGLLLATPPQSSNQLVQISDYYQGSNQIRYWHEKCLTDASNFIVMCMQLNLVPNIFGLHEWANWLAPSFQKIRFDNFMFICFLQRIPQQELFLINKEEVECLEVLEENSEFFFLFRSHF